MKKILSILSLMLVALTASAKPVAAEYKLTVGETVHGTVVFKVNDAEVTAAPEGETVTVEVTPEAGWATGSATGLWYAAVAKAPRRAANIDLTKDFELTPVEGNENAFTFVMKRANAEISVGYKKLITADMITVATPTNIYTGSELQPAVSVTYTDGTEEVTLVEGTDYSVSYANNINVPAEDATDDEQPTVTVTAIANDKVAASNASKTFTITPKDISNDDETPIKVIVERIPDQVYTGDKLEPAVVLKYGNQTLVEGTDYTVLFSSNSLVGTAHVQITGKGNYSGETQTTFTIVPAVLTYVSLVETAFEYNPFDPKSHTAQIREVRAGNLIVPASQYYVEGATQTRPGQYTVTVTGHTNYTGTVTATFEITDKVVSGSATDAAGKPVDGLTMTVTEVSRAARLLRITHISGGAGSEALTVVIPSEINGWTVESIGPAALSEMTNVTDIIMPESQEPIAIGVAAFPTTATVHTPLALLDDYALMETLKQHYEGGKVKATVTPAGKYWTLGLGCDVVLPKELTAYTAQAQSQSQVAATAIDEEQLTVNEERVVKSNNGVLLAGEADRSYDLVAYSGRIASGTPISTEDKKEYGADNQLEPVIAEIDYVAGDSYFQVLSNAFRSFDVDDADVEVKIGTAVLHLTSGQAGADAKQLSIEVVTTGIDRTPVVSQGEGVCYDLQGRRVAQPKKGVYIVDGKKKVVK